MSITPETFDMWKNFKITKTAVVSIIKIIKKAISILLRLKNTGLHKRFNTVCVTKQKYPLALLFLVIVTEYKITAAKRVPYRIIHTGEISKREAAEQVLLNCHTIMNCT